MTANWTAPAPTLYDRLHDRLDDATEDVLATVVAVEGTAYRRPGAKLLLEPEATVGAITPGCLEPRLIEAAETVRETGESRLETYDLTADGEDWGLGVGCEGVIDVLLEPLDDSYRPAVDAVTGGRDVAVLTVLDDDGPLARGDRAYYHPDTDEHTVASGDPDAWPVADCQEPARTLAESGRADVLTLEQGDRSLWIFVDGLQAPDELLVFGTGRDVGPVVELGATAGFRVTVVGFRGAVDLAERFPGADRTVTTAPGRLADEVEVTDRSYAVVMTHNAVDDRLTVETLLETPAPYIGLMGPHERFEQVREHLAAEGRPMTAADRNRIYSPIGLDLGDGSPYGIAHSIVAEVLAVSNDRRPQHLRDRETAIHERAEVDPAESSDPTTTQADDE